MKIKLTAINFSFFIPIHKAFVHLHSNSCLGNHSELYARSYEPFFPYIDP